VHGSVLTDAQRQFSPHSPDDTPIFGAACTIQI